MKSTCLALLVVAACFLSCIDAKPQTFGGSRRRFGLRYVTAIPRKREVAFDELAAEVNQLSDESQQKLAKQLLAGLLLLTIDSENSAEVDQLTLAFKKAADKNWENIDDYATELFQIYEEVTGRKPDDRKK